MNEGSDSIICRYPWYTCLYQKGKALPTTSMHLKSLKRDEACFFSCFFFFFLQYVLWTYCDSVHVHVLHFHVWHSWPDIGSGNLAGNKLAIWLFHFFSCNYLDRIMCARTSTFWNPVSVTVEVVLRHNSSHCFIILSMQKSYVLNFLGFQFTKN